MACDISKLTNFSTEQKQLIATCVDAYTEDLSNFVSSNVDVSEKSIEQTIRDRFEKEILQGEKWSYRTFRKYKNDLYAILEVILDQVLPEGWSENEFFNRFVEVIRVDLGDQNEFYAEENGYLTVSKFSGNHWDTIRERMDLGTPITIPTSWWEVHFYNEFERFMKGIDSFAKMLDKVRKSFINNFQNATYTAFAGLASYVPAAFAGSGALSTPANMTALLTVAEKVSAANGGANVTFVGTRAALRNLMTNLDTNWVAESAKEDRKRVGIVSDWEGFSVLPIPQVFQAGTFNFALNDNQILMVANNRDEKPIKFVYEGESRIKDVNDYRENVDMTLEEQVHVKAGLGVIAGSTIGVWNLA